jgi:hypothetical protein
MTKTSFTKLVCSVAGLMLGAAMLAPVLVHAQNDNALSANDKIKKNICTLYSNKFSKATGKIADNQIKLDSMRAEQLSKLGKNQADYDQKLSNIRITADQKRATQIVKMIGKASTSEQKAAVETFNAAITKALADRRSTVDSATTAYRTALDKVLTDRKTSINQATATYKAAVEAAYAKASSSCQSAVDKKTITKTLNADLKAAKDKFNSDRQSVDKFRSLIAPLLKTRQQAINNAVKAYNKAVEDARVALKAAFPIKAKK